MANMKTVERLGHLAAMCDVCSVDPTSEEWERMRHSQMAEQYRKEQAEELQRVVDDEEPATQTMGEWVESWGKKINSAPIDSLRGCLETDCIKEDMDRPIGAMTEEEKIERRLDQMDEDEAGYQGYPLANVLGGGPNTSKRPGIFRAWLNPWLLTICAMAAIEVKGSPQ